MIEARRAQRSFGEGLITAEIKDLPEPRMTYFDAIWQMKRWSRLSTTQTFQSEKMCRNKVNASVPGRKPADGGPIERPSAIREKGEEPVTQKTCKRQRYT